MVEVYGYTFRNVHDPGQCAGKKCVIHNRTEHALRDRPVKWNDPLLLFERVCEHGWRVIDPDCEEFASSRGWPMVEVCCGYSVPTGPKVKCWGCGEVVQSLYRHHFVTCRCGQVSVDGGPDYTRVLGERWSYVDDDQTAEVH